MLTLKKTAKLRITDTVWRNLPPMNILTRDSNAEDVTMSWRYHEKQTADYTSMKSYATYYLHGTDTNS